MLSPHSGVDLSIQNLTRRFKDRVVIDQFNLEIKAGEFVALLGPSGSGKSTLLRLIAELDRPSAGLIRIGESDAQKSIVFQDPTLLPWRNLRENLDLVTELTGKKSLNVNDTLKLVGLEKESEKYPRQLSGGMRMRASVARALLTQPKLLLLDEPFAALDENTRQRLQEELHAIWMKEKMTIIFVTHSISEAAFLASRAIVLGGHPATLVLDQEIKLTLPRNAKLRTDASYFNQIKILSETLTL